MSKVQRISCSTQTLENAQNICTEAVVETKARSSRKVVGQLLVHEGGWVRVAGDAARLKSGLCTCCVLAFTAYDP